ncbi:MAG: ATP-binding cassette domain-containing protein, partial [Devosia nanyangense]|nr:ATP-binding cassette domain-containing protein [Devosia nanyangense]
MSQPILSLKNLTKTFDVNGHEVKAVSDVSFDVMPGECLAIVGESGSGKSTIANMVLGIYGPTSGSMVFEGTELPTRRDLAHRRAIQLVQQNPLSALNPRRTIGASLRLALDVHNIGERSGRNKRVGELLEEVGLPADFAKRRP